MEMGNQQSNSYAGLMPMHVAVQWGLLDNIKSMVSHKHDINVCDKNGRTPLHYAVMFDNYEIVDYLIATGANIDCIDKHGNTPLIEAIIDNSIQMVKHLINKGANVNMNLYGPNSKSPLHVAVYLEHLDIAKYLINHDANVNYVDGCGDYPIDHSTLNFDCGMRKLLVANRAVTSGSFIDDLIGFVC